MYDATPDPYCYPGTTILRNLAGLLDQDALDQFELASFTQRATEGLPAGRLSVRHLSAVHHHLFQDVYRWAGRYRTVRISKGGSAFCYPENIGASLKSLFGWLKRENYLKGLNQHAFARQAAHFLAELNAIHPFRDGNGRTQLAFMAIVADQAGHPLAIERVRREPFLAAMIASFHGKEEKLADELLKLL